MRINQHGVFINCNPMSTKMCKRFIALLLPLLSSCTFCLLLNIMYLIFLFSLLVRILGCFFLKAKRCGEIYQEYDGLPASLGIFACSILWSFFFFFNVFERL